MFPYDKILAKSNPEVTLLQHTEDCLRVFSNVIKWHEILLDRLSEKYEIEKKFLIWRLYLTVAFHDIGKATKAFQAKVRGESFIGQESHALTSVLFLYDIIKDNPVTKFGNVPYYPELISIASHHSKLYKKLFDTIRLKNEYAPKSFFEKFYSFVNEEAHKQKLSYSTKITYNESCLNSDPRHILRYELISQFDRDSFRYEKSTKARDIFLVFKSILHYCDWIASSGDRTYHYGNDLNVAIITSKLRNSQPDFNQWTNFQIKSAQSFDKNIFVQIATGQGKTEAAILWAINNNFSQKIIFLLPTMVTTNKMYKRMLGFFGQEDIVGLSHSAAEYYLWDEEFDTDEKRKHSLYNRTFFKPVTVATIDQLIYSFFNWGHWVMTGVASYNAKIIIDEIHVYDAFTFGLLLQAIECIKPYNARFALMSASLPNVLKSELEKVLPDYKLIHAPEHDHLQRHTLELSDCLIEETTERIFDFFDKGYKVLVVCNTIAKAREVFQKLVSIPYDKKLLYHSQFLLSDKRGKEQILEELKKVPGPYVAVCTQIVEVSLDIDFDVLITENAPIDAIIQRLGRVNRRGTINARHPDLQFGKVVITRESEISRKYVYNSLDRIVTETYHQLLIRSNENNGHFKEKDFRELVNNIYTREALGEDYFKEINDAKQLVKTLWRDVLKMIYTLDIEDALLHKVTSRKSDYITVDAVTMKHFQEVDFDEIIRNKRFDILNEYTIKVPIYLVKKFGFKKMIDDTFIYLLNLDYDPIFGLHLDLDKSNFI
jgi:CRISPR-associated helicase Cas3/CRISPR-associated endonuclease Cas3-HD